MESANVPLSAIAPHLSLCSVHGEKRINKVKSGHMSTERMRMRAVKGFTRYH